MSGAESPVAGPAEIDALLMVAVKGMTSAQSAAQIRARLHAEVGAFFANTSRGPGRCAVCTAPAPVELCRWCANQRASYGSSLADLVVPLAYIRGWMSPPHQSEQHIRQYKHPVQPSPGYLHDLKLMMLAGTLLHGQCIARTVGWWQVVTFVPSVSRPGVQHPVAQLARQVAAPNPNTQRILLALGPGFAAGPDRWPRPDRFVVPSQFMPMIADRRVLLVDDSWVSGGKSQSAALTLKAAGAAAVTIVCIGRWLNYRWYEHRPLIERLIEPYDALRCPVTGSQCPTDSEPDHSR